MERAFMSQALQIDPVQLQRTKRLRLLLSVAMIVLVVLAYAPVFSADFITLDDDDYVVSNPLFQGGFTWASIARCFTQYHSANWHPITWLSHLIDVTLYGLDPAGHHATNVLLHLINALVLFKLLDRWMNSTALAGAISLLFALHPAQVESVAWVSERKNVLSMLFGLICLWAYTRYVMEPTVKRYLLVLLWLTLGLMSKPMLVTWPCVMVLLDIWPLGRTRWATAARGMPAIARPSLARLLLEKLPMAAIVALSCVLTVRAQNSFGALDASIVVPLSDRLLNGVVSYARYLGTWIWPDRLALLYPLVPHWSTAAVGGSIALLLAITTLALALFRRAPYVLVGWLWFLGTLVPVLGVIQVGAQSMADRYLYVPIIGLFIALGLSVRDLTLRWPALLTRPVIALLACLSLGYTLVTHQQATHWADSVSLYQHTLAVTSDNPRTHFLLAGAYFRAEQLDLARVHMEKAAALAPTDPMARACVATMLADGKPDPVVEEHLHAALQYGSRDPRVLSIVAGAYERMNMPQKAAFYRTQASQLKK